MITSANPSTNRGLGIVLISLLAFWFLGVLTAASFGVFDAGTRYSMRLPLPLGLAAVLPVVIFSIWFQASSRLREQLFSLDPVVLTTVHVYRVGGIAFLILLAKGNLPPLFALPAGLGDMTIGVTAPFIAQALSRGSVSRSGFVRWQLAGITDLVVALTLGVLYSPSPLGILAHGVTTRAMGQLPMTLIPTFAVPLLVILHIICIVQARQTMESDTRLQAAPSRA
jgi:hypothetical protein